MKSFHDLARAAYDAYCEEAGGLTYDGKKLPSYGALGPERQACWVAAVKEAAALIKNIH